MKFALLAVAISSVALLTLRALALRLNWLDQPDARKAHAEPVPAVGGLAWILGWMPVFWFSHQIGASFTGLMLGAMLLALIGAFDDIRPMPSVLRLALQSLAVLIAIYPSGTVLLQLGALFWPATNVLLPSWVAWPMTIFAIVGVINALNMIDGMDGALACVSAIALAALIALFHHVGANVPAFLAGLALAALAPFMLLNIRTPWLSAAKVFFGDAGSTVMGLLIGYLLVFGSQTHLAANAFSPVTALFVVAVPLIDTVSLMLRRISRGRSPFEPDQEHLHHLLQRFGLSVPMALLWISAAAGLIAITGIALHYLAVPTWVSTSLFMCGALSYHLLVTRVIKLGHCFGRPLAERLVPGS
jgi:UDP-GlcNAc:undecaprenyl-phosphate/decaprenyl-phosphate GlcNAc-1-phosphate transferase